jgi:hypothetical protein
MLFRSWFSCFRVTRAKQNLLTQNLSCSMLCDTKYCWRHITKQIPSIVAALQLVVCQVTLSTSLHTHQPFVYDTKYYCCLATCLSGHIVNFTTHTSTICIRYQVLFVSCNMFVRSHCQLHFTHINCLYTIPSIVGGILRSI